MQRSYLSWNWIGIQNLGRNRVAISKLAKGIWQILTWALESLKNFHFNGLLLSKVYIVWAKKYIEVIFHETKEGYKIWRGNDLSFQNWHKEFDKFWREHSKVSKIFTLMGSFWAKYILFELKKYREVIFHETEKGYKIWRGTGLSFQNWHKEFDKFWPKHSKVSKIFPLRGSFWANYIFFELKKYRGVIFHETEGGYKIWREMDLSFQNWHKEFDKIWCEHSKVSKSLTLMGSFWAKYILFELKKYREVIFHETEEGYKIWRGTDLSFQNWQEIWQILTWALDFWTKYILFELKKYRGVISHDIEEWCKIWRKIDLLLGKWQEFGKFSPEHL